jgi:protein transport protein SEC20
MQTEITRSRFAQETLEQSTAALADLGDKYSDLNSLLANSKTLVSTLLRSQKSDTWYLETTFYILITTVIWLIFRRWLYGPISWFLIWPLKLLFRILFAIVPIGASSAASFSLTSPSQPSTSLIVQPSATAGLPKRPKTQNNQNYVRVGGGGRGVAHDPSPPQSLSQSVGQMAEQNQQQQAQREGPREQVVRGDGTVLPDRDAPANPKKKMWDEGVESAKFEQKQKDGEQQILGQQGGTESEGQGNVRRKRDEL